MLSIENPPDPVPADPSCSSSYQFQHQLNSSSSDERASHKSPQQQEVVDLPNSDLLHQQHNTRPLPNFSIRDYVFTARSKDIKKNWPFSLKNLQLCVKHGVKELLPPLQPLDTLNKPSLKICLVETSSVEKGKTDNLAVLDASDDPQLNDKVVESCLDVISSCRSGDENDFPSTTTSVSHSEIESLTVNRLSSSQTETFQRTSAAFEAAGPSAGNNKTVNTPCPSSKKCRLIVKFGVNSDRSSTEDIASNSTAVSETMASKVCPVCKTFSSSSNTTLNAHIDQCLSVESTPKWTSDSKLTRHRIKPRKTRMMVDVYSTALPCTLEELDRRNGTSWATVSCLPTRQVEKTGNAETINEGKKMRVSHVHPEDVGDVGPVYIDANGTKLRILSKFDDQPSVSKVVEDVEARKPQKGGDKGSKYMSKKKKKRLAQKHHKFMKLPSQSKINFSQKAHGSQIVEEECQGEAKSCEKEHRVSNEKPSDFVTLRPWVCSKRRGLTKKTSQEGHQPVRCNWHLPQDLLVYNGQSFFEESLTERNVAQKFTNLSENPTSSSAKNDRIEKTLREDKVSKKIEQSPGRKRMQNLLMTARSNDNLGGRSPMKPNSIQLGNCGTSVNDSRVATPSNSTRNHSSLLSKRAFGASGSANNSDVSCIQSIKSSQDVNAILSKRMKLSSLRKNRFCVNGRSSVTESVPGKAKKLSALKKSQLRFMKKRNEKGVTCQSGVDQQYDLMRGNAENQDEREEIADESFEMSTALEPRKGRGIRLVSQGEEALALRTSKPSSHFYDHDVPVTADSSVGAGDDFLRKVNCLDSSGDQVRVYVDDVVVDPSSNTSNERSAACMMKSVDSEFYGLSNSLNVQPESLRSAEDYRRLLCGTEAPPAPTESHFVNDQEMFSAGNDIMAGQDSRIAAQLDSEARNGHSFPEVDPIPIPGPPGSFLPSPRDMGSEDFQGNSSLTTSRVHSSLDQHDAVDGDSSDSPMSAASTISNSIADRRNFKYSEPSSSVGPYDKIRSSAASVESSLQSVDAIPLVSGTEVERIGFDGGYSKLDRIYVEKGSLSFKNDQPCCCQRKERFSQSVALNFQESQLLRRRKMALITIPTGGKQMDFNSGLKFANSEARSEFAPPGSCPNPGSEKMGLPVIKPLAGTISFRDSPSSAGVKFLARVDSGSASPSASNPVLRLMGKNLLVVNKDDDTSVPVGAVQPQIQNNLQTSQFLANFSEVSPGNIHNHDSHHPLHHVGSQASLIFGQSSHKPVGQCYDASVIFGQSSHKPVGQYCDGGLSNSFRSDSDSRLHVNAQLPAVMFQDQHMDYGFATPTEYHELEGDYNVSRQHIMFKNRPDADNMEKVIAAPERRRQHEGSPQNPVKEIIMIDDVPERENALVSSGILIPTASKYNPNRLHPFSCYDQSQDQSPVVESPMVMVRNNANYRTTPSKLGSNTCPVRWGCSSEGSGVVQRSPFTSATSSPSHIRPTTHHYSPGFS